jgi:hypothetical protein
MLAILTYRKYNGKSDDVMKIHVREYHNSSCGCVSPLDVIMMITLEALCTYFNQKY